MSTTPIHRAAELAESVATDSRPYQPGTLVDQFRILRLGGRGGMGEVYVARDTTLGRRVALKVIPPHRLGSEEAVQQFLLEARMTATFNHPNIVTIYHAGRHEQRPYVALEYLEGQTLRERLGNGLPPLTETLRYGAAIAEALAEAHRHLVLHKDLKPENILIPADGRLRVLDFGLAGRVDSACCVGDEGPQLREGGGAGRSKLDQLRGTPEYMAPEQWSDGAATEASDVWALGVILYELLGGSRPYSGASFFGLALKVGGPEPVPPLPGADGFPEPLVGLVHGCLAKDPTQRPSAIVAARALRELLARRAPPATREDSAFIGLKPFTERDATVFFGRDAEVDAMAERLRSIPVLPVVGPCGAGKSSLVQAGLIPRLRDHGPLTVISMRPGMHPFRTLAHRLLRCRAALRATAGAGAATIGADDERRHAAAVERLAARLLEIPSLLSVELTALTDRSAGTVLLFVDQLEELHTLVEDRTTRRRFMDALCTGADDSQSPVRVVFALRDDFMGRLAEGPAARETLSRVALVRPPSVEQLAEILTRPLALAGYSYCDPSLPTEMIAEVDGEAGSLPLLQFVCRALWDRRDEERRLLLRAVYEEIGGVTGALARNADAVLEGLSTAGEKAARQILLRLVTPDRTRRLAARAEVLLGLSPELGGLVLDRLIEERLVHVRRGWRDDREESLLELAHESLIAGWSRLSRWVDDAHDDLAFLAEVGQAAELWQRWGGRIDEVWQGEQLNEALRARDRCNAPIPPAVEAFLIAGRRRMRSSLTKRRLLIVASLMLLTAVAVVLQLQKQDAEQHRRRAETERQLAGQRWSEAQRESARAALARGDMLEARAKLRSALEQEDSALARALWWRLRATPMRWRHELGGVLRDVAISPDGQTIAAACADSSIHLFDSTGRLRGLLRGHRDRVYALAFSPCGKRLISGSRSGELRLWRLDQGQPQITHAVQVSAAPISRVASDPRGQLFATASHDGHIKLWDARTAQLLRVNASHSGHAYGIAFSPDGLVLASTGADRKVLLRAVTDGRVVQTLALDATAFDVAFSADGHRLASAGYDGTVRLADVETGAEIGRYFAGTAALYRVSFGDRDRLLVATSADGSAHIWDVQTRKPVGRLAAHTGFAYGLALHPDGKHLATVGADRFLRVWRLGQSTPASPHGHRSAVHGVAFTPDGGRVLTAGQDGTVRVWDTRSGDQRAVMDHGAELLAVAVSADGTLAASAGRDAPVRLWNAASGKLLRSLEHNARSVPELAFTGDSRRLLAASSDGVLRLWKVPDGELQRRFDTGGREIYGLAVNHDATLAAITGSGRSVRVWDLRSRRLVATLEPGSAPTHGVAFLDGDEKIAVGSYDGVLRLWDWRRQRTQTLSRLPGRIYGVDASPGGALVAVAASDGLTRLVEIREGRTTLVAGHRAEVNVVRFDPTGARLATTSDDGTVQMWTVPRGRPLWRAPLMLHDPPRLLTPAGWIALEQDSGPAAPTASTSAWSRAAERSAHVGDAEPAGDILCLGTHAGAVELWSRAHDRQLLSRAFAGRLQVVAVPGGCLVRHRGGATLLGRDGTRTTIAKAAAAVARDGDHLLVVADQVVLFLDLTGRVTRRVQTGPRASAALRVGAHLAVGFEDGTAELLPLEATPRRQIIALTQAPASPLLRLHRGPSNTLIAGHASGEIVIWDTRARMVLYRTKLHGAIHHIAGARGRVYVASDLGNYRTIDLRTFQQPYCEVLRQVWNEVPVTWHDGEPVVRPAPAHHRCSN